MNHYNIACQIRGTKCFVNTKEEKIYSKTGKAVEKTRQLEGALKDVVSGTDLPETVGCFTNVFVFEQELTESTR